MEAEDDPLEAARLRAARPAAEAERRMHLVYSQSGRRPTYLDTLQFVRQLESLAAWALAEAKVENNLLIQPLDDPGGPEELREHRTKLARAASVFAEVNTRSLAEGTVGDTLSVFVGSLVPRQDALPADVERAWDEFGAYLELAAPTGGAYPDRLDTDDRFELLSEEDARRDIAPEGVMQKIASFPDDYPLAYSPPLGSASALLWDLDVEAADMRALEDSVLTPPTDVRVPPAFEWARDATTYGPAVVGRPMLVYKVRGDRSGGASGAYLGLRPDRYSLHVVLLDRVTPGVDADNDRDDFDDSAAYSQWPDLGSTDEDTEPEKEEQRQESQRAAGEREALREYMESVQNIEAMLVEINAATQGSVLRQNVDILQQNRDSLAASGKRRRVGTQPCDLDRTVIF